jgi:hypothetical protein
MPGSNNKVHFSNGIRLEPSSAEEWQLMQLAPVTTNVSIINNQGNPEGVVPANMGSICQDNLNGNMYLKHTGTGVTGWVLISTGGSTATVSFGMQTGIDPVVPDPSGLVTFDGAVVAAGTNPVRTDGTGANTMALEVQISQAVAASDATKIGLSNFDSSQFSVDANGFVHITSGGDLPIATQSEYFDDLVYDWDASLTTPRGPFNFITNSGVQWEVADATNHPGILRLNTTSTSGSFRYSSSSDLTGTGPAIGQYGITWEWMMRIHTLSAANPTYILYLGYWDGSFNDPLTSASNGVFFRYTHSTNSGNWTINTKSGGATTTANTSTAADTEWHRYKITVDAAGTSVGFFIDNVQVANSPIVATIPTVKMQMQGSVTGFSGSNNKTFDWDYFYAKYTFTR